MSEEIWHGVNPKFQLFRASGSTKYTSFIDIDIGIRELIIKTHLSITIRLLRQLSKPNRYVTFFWDTLYDTESADVLGGCLDRAHRHHWNWRADHKNTLKHYNKAAEAAIKTKLLCNIFLGHPVVLGKAQ